MDGHTLAQFGSALGTVCGWFIIGGLIAFVGWLGYRSTRRRKRRR